MWSTLSGQSWLETCYKMLAAAIRLFLTRIFFPRIYLFYLLLQYKKKSNTAVEVRVMLAVLWGMFSGPELHTPTHLKSTVSDKIQESKRSFIKQCRIADVENGFATSIWSHGAGPNYIQWFINLPIMHANSYTNIFIEIKLKTGNKTWVFLITEDGLLYAKYRVNLEKSWWWLVGIMAKKYKFL